MGVKVFHSLTMDVKQTRSDMLLSKNQPLCFNQEDFTNENFSVDKFVSEHRKHVTLEKLRDDLSTHLKVVKSSMVELINQDYADFVNLSTNLAGLDKSINNLCIPLGQLREEVLMVKSALDEALETARYQVEYQTVLRNKKLTLQRVSAILNGVEKLEKLNDAAPFSNNKSQNQNEPLESLIERIANELIHVKFHLNEIPNLPLIEDLRPKVQRITDSLQTYLNETFLQSLNKNDRVKLQLVLRINSSLGLAKDTQALFLNNVVHPYVTNIICENNLKRGIRKMYKEVLDFVPLKCKQILELTTTQISMPEAITGYNFLVDVIWPEIVNCLESRIPVIFSPGNPEQFHKYYLATDEFICSFEALCPNETIREEFIKSKHYVSFTNKWNLPVYFQIQFPKIAGALEIALTKELHLTNAGSDFQLTVSDVLFKSIKRCWSPDVFLPKLAHRFWKLTLQLITRFCVWAEQAAKFNVKATSQSLEDSTDTAVNNISLSNGPNSTTEKKSNVVNLVMLVKDVTILQSKVPLFFNQVICPALKTRGFSNDALLKDGLDQSTVKLNELSNSLGRLITKQLATQCGLNLKQVPDIPRLYRKTNKEVPTKPSNYVNILLNPLETFLLTHKESLPKEIYLEWSNEVVERLTEQYLTVTRDVLHSVKRVEDSMKILRKAREKTPTLGNSNQTSMSDDDKIRLQLLIDIETYGQKVEELGLSSSSFSSYVQLKETAESARNSLPGNS